MFAKRPEIHWPKLPQPTPWPDKGTSHRELPAKVKPTKPRAPRKRSEVLVFNTDTEVTTMIRSIDSDGETSKSPPKRTPISAMHK